MSYQTDLLFDSFLYEDDDDDNGSLDCNSVVVRGQFILDGASTLEEAADLVRAYADYLDMLSEEGYELQSRIQDDEGIAVLN